jgi:WD40 repeat protein
VNPYLRASFCSITLSAAVFAQVANPLAKLEAPAPLNFVVVCDGGGSLVGVTAKSEVYSWSLPSGTRQTINLIGGPVSWGKVACNSNLLALGLNSGAVVVFDPAGAERRRIDIKGSVGAIAVSADGSLLAAATSLDPLRVWDVASGKHLWSGSNDFGNTQTIAISPDGNLIIAADTDTHIRAYNRQGKLAYSVDSGLLELFGLGFSLDGKEFTVGGAEGALALYDTATGRKLKTSENSGNTIWRIVMSPSGAKVMAEEEDDGYRMDTVAVGLWDTSGTQLKKLPVDPKTVIGFGRNAKQLLLVRQDSPGQIVVDSVE